MKPPPHPQRTEIITVAIRNDTARLLDTICGQAGQNIANTPPEKLTELFRRYLRGQTRRTEIVDIDGVKCISLASLGRIFGWSNPTLAVRAKKNELLSLTHTTIGGKVFYPIESVEVWAAHVGLLKQLDDALEGLEASGPVRAPWMGNLPPPVKRSTRLHPKNASFIYRKIFGDLIRMDDALASMDPSRLPTTGDMPPTIGEQIFGHHWCRVLDLDTWLTKHGLWDDYWREGLRIITRRPAEDGPWAHFDPPFVKYPATDAPAPAEPDPPRRPWRPSRRPAARETP